MVLRDGASVDAFHLDSLTSEEVRTGHGSGRRDFQNYEKVRFLDLQLHEDCSARY